MCHVLVSQQTGEAFGLFGVLLGGFHSFVEGFCLHLTRALRDLRQFLQNVTEVHEVVVVRMEQAALLRRFRKRHDGLRDLVDGGELHRRICNVVWVAA